MPTFSLRRVVVAALVAIGALGASPVRQDSSEIVQETGHGAPAPTDLAKFFARVHLAFVGTLESVSVDFLDGLYKPTLFTQLRFQPVEFIQKDHAQNPQALIEVWMTGGTYRQTASGLQPVRPSVIAERLHIGSRYFIATGIVNDPPFRGHEFLYGGDTIVEITDGRVTAPSNNDDWVRSVVTQGRAYSPTPGQVADDSTAFLRSVRRAGRLVK